MAGQREGAVVQWSRDDRFAVSWLPVCVGFPTGTDHDRAGGFVQQWSGSGEHGHGGHSHVAHGGYGDGYETFGGGHHRGAGMGGHGGH